MSGLFGDGIRRHAAQTGQIVWGWNFLQAGFLEIFEAIVCPDDHALALALWHEIASDMGQRKLVVAAAKATIEKGSKLLSDIEWLDRRATDLSPYRNDGVHTGISLGGDWDGKGYRMMVYPDVKSGKPAAVARLEEKPVDDYWRTVKGDLWVLGRYANTVAGRIRGSTSYEPPALRPRLLTLPSKTKKKTKSRTVAKKA